MSAWAFIDLDGTLMDSAPGIMSGIRHAMGVAGVPIPDDVTLRGCIGPSFTESFPRLGVPPEMMQPAMRAYREAYHINEGMYDALPYEGAHDMLAALKGMGFRLALCTAKPIETAVKITARFDIAPMLEREYGPLPDGTFTHKADLLAHALTETGADPAKSFMIGDRRHDIDAGRANKVTPIGVLWGYGSRAELEEAGAAAIAESRADVAKLIEGLR